MKMSTFLFLLVSIAAGLANAAPPRPSPAVASAAPFGLELGTASCDALKTRLGTTQEKPLGGSDVWIESPNPDQLYPGASKVAGRCSSGKVIAIQVEASKGGMGAEGAREAFSSLRSKYKLASGGPMPSLGDGYARFTYGNSIIEQSSPHLSFVFSITYYTRDFYEGLAAKTKRDENSTVEKKRSAL
jgi:hypothetical protein